jgi:hypothetical protein
MRRTLGVSIALALLAIPIAMKPLSLGSRLITVTLAFVAALRTIDLYSERPSRPAGLRVVHVFMLFDTRLVTRCRPHLDSRLAGEAAVWGALSFASLFVAAKSPLAPAAAHYIFRWLWAIVWIYALFETLARVIPLLLGILGLEISPQHDAPYKARSLREFWSVRWNRLIGLWLREHCYTWFKKRGRDRLGVVVSFAASALIHLYVMYVVLDLRWALIMSCFFPLQMLLLWAEDALHIRRRSALVSRVWTFSVLILLSPLITEPLLQFFGL